MNDDAFNGQLVSKTFLSFSLCLFGSIYNRLEVVKRKRRQVENVAVVVQKQKRDAVVR